MKKINSLLGAAVLLAACQAPSVQLTDEELNSDWAFWMEHDTARVMVNLPHDAQQCTGRDANVPGGNATGYMVGAVYHYQKTFQADASLLQKHVTFQFEGVYRNATVLINGQKAGGAAYGYIPFEVVADGLLHEGENTLEVIADNSKLPNSRWYSGGGIYRPVHMLVQEKDAFIEDVKVLTTSISPAKVRLQTAHQGGEVSAVLLLNGKEVARAEGDDVEITVDNAQLWTAETPTLYQALVQLKKDGKVVEERTEDFGIRQLSWNAQQGFLVNGVPTLLRGGCVHHDNGVLGACEYDDAAMRRIAKLKEFGFNAIRSSHNPCSEAVLRACDKLGMYVMDELWDMWYTTKTAQDYSLQWRDNWEYDVQAFVKKDYNHPSVVMYSIGNEVGEPHNQEGYDTEQKIVDLLHQLDNSRPTTAGLNLMIMMMASMDMNIFDQQAQNAAAPQQVTSEQYNAMLTAQGSQMMQAVLAPQVDAVADPACKILDIAGYNYGQLRYDLDAQKNPDRMLVGSETMPYDIVDNWAKVERYPQLVGDFMWTAWDYLGECGIGSWYYSETDMPSFSKPFPWVLAGAGAFDLVGNPNSEAYWARVTWVKDDKPYITVNPILPGKLIKSMWRGTYAIPSWSWMGEEGKTTQVEVYTSAPKVQLFLNGEQVGEKATEKGRAIFDVVYQPGTLKAVSISADGKQQEAELTSATGEVRIAAHAEKDSYQVGELIFVDVNLEGENGVVVSNQDQQLFVAAEGAKLLGYGSAKPMTEERFITGIYTTHEGQSLAVLKAEKAGTVKVTVKSTQNGKKLQDCVTTITVK